MDEHNNGFYGWQPQPEPTPAPAPYDEGAEQLDEYIINPATEPATSEDGLTPPPPPAYSPYPPPQWTPIAPPKRKRTGLIVGVVLGALLLILGICFTVVVSMLIVNDNDSGSSFLEGNTPAITDDSRLDLEETPEGDKSITALEGGLTPVEIYNKMRDANVAVQVYSSRSDSVTGEGSGILIHEDSTGTYTYVVTCAHVIDDNLRVSIELDNGDSYDAEIVGWDSKTDVGLLRIKKTGLAGASFGDSAKLQVGEPVYAIGNPGGVDFKGSFTSGMVSAIDRAIKSTYKMITIQHTAPISPGNSGGALVNALGQVIGINSQKIIDSDYDNIGFAIPSKTVQEVVNNLIATGYVPNRPKLGIQYLAAVEATAGAIVVRTNDLPSGSLIIAGIDEGSDISGTDVRVNDIITHVNGDPLNKADVLLEAVEKGEVGDTLRLSIARVDSRNFSITTFDVDVKLIEDKGTTVTEEETQPWYYEEFPYGW